MSQTTTSTASEAKRIGKAARLREMLELFPILPNEARVDLDFVCILKRRSKASIWRDVAAGRLAPPVKAGPRCTRWLVGDIREAA
jgi:hypothetical protein